MSITEPLVPGAYTALLDLKIRTQMDTKSLTNQVGTYMRGVPFTVFEVYPEDKNGIVWGRVSSNTGAGVARYVGLRVTNQMKAHLEQAFEPAEKIDLAQAILILAKAVDANTRAIEKLNLK